MKRALIDPQICCNCDVCQVDDKCPQKAVIKEDDSDKPWIDFYKCRGCMKCKAYCNNNAIIEETKPCDGGFSQTW